MNKSRILNIIIIVLAVALIIFLVAKNKKTDETPTPVEENTSSENGNTPELVVPTPAEESWKEATVDNKINIEIPETYYVSHPVIGDCKDVTSISTQTASNPTVSIALVYKEGCVTDTDVTTYYSKREVREGYVFQTNSSNSSVLKIFDRIVASAKAK